MRLKGMNSSRSMILVFFVVIGGGGFYGCGNIIEGGDPKLISITVVPSDVVIPVGGVQRFTASGISEDGVSMDVSDRVTWSSSDATVAAIDPATGVATAGDTPATVLITASASDVSGTTVVNVLDLNNK